MDPAKALEALNGLPKGKAQVSGRSLVLARLAASDSTAALAAADALPGNVEKIDAQAAIANAVAAKDPALAAQIRESLPGESARKGFQSVHAYNSSDPAGSLEKAAALDDAVIRSDLMHSAASEWFADKPGDALAYAVQQSSAGNPAWVNVLAEDAIDMASIDGWNIATDYVNSWISQVKNLDPPMRAIWVTELQTQPASLVRDRLLQAIQ
jgi:hypothetical protein